MYLSKHSIGRIHLVRAVSVASVAILLAVGLCQSGLAGEYVAATPLSKHMQEVRYGYASDRLAFNGASSGSYQYGFLANDESDGDEFGNEREFKSKSPFTAFLLSAAVPGAGQWYYGSRVKPFLFLGVEVTAWTLNLTWHGQGQDATDAYEVFHQAHWSENRYEDYLEWAYQGEGGEWRDDDSLNFREISHHLPDQWIQQYFEMTGKYDQFAWGWDDAVYQGRTFDTYSLADPPPRITGEATLPYSARRVRYETMRNDANKKFDRARNMVVVAIANRLVSALEAYFVTKSRQSKAKKSSDEFLGSLKPRLLERVHVSAKLKSYHEKRDTPWVNVTYKF